MYDVAPTSPHVDARARARPIALAPHARTLKRTSPGLVRERTRARARRTTREATRTRREGSTQAAKVDGARVRTRRAIRRDDARDDDGVVMRARAMRGTDAGAVDEREVDGVESRGERDARDGAARRERERESARGRVGGEIGTRLRWNDARCAIEW